MCIEPSSYYVIRFIVCLGRAGMEEGADGSRWIFEEQETQIENDRLAIARLNTKLEHLSANRFDLDFIRIWPGFVLNSTRFLGKKKSKKIKQ